MQPVQLSMNQTKDVSTDFKKAAAKVLTELERTLGKDLDDQEKFMFVHGTAECKLPEPREDFSKSSTKCDQKMQLGEQEMEVYHKRFNNTQPNPATKLSPATFQ